MSTREEACYGGGAALAAAGAGLPPAPRTAGGSGLQLLVPGCAVVMSALVKGYGTPVSRDPYMCFTFAGRGALGPGQCGGARFPLGSEKGNTWRYAVFAVLVGRNCWKSPLS
nr:hypothetical protein StreXyl84_69850 [Streptomyces sp. Xyl84]